MRTIQHSLHGSTVTPVVTVSTVTPVVSVSKPERIRVYTKLPLAVPHPQQELIDHMTTGFQLHNYSVTLKGR